MTLTKNEQFYSGNKTISLDANNLLVAFAVTGIKHRLCLPLIRQYCHFMSEEERQKLLRKDNADLKIENREEVTLVDGAKYHGQWLGT